MKKLLASALIILLIAAAVPTAPTAFAEAEKIKVACVGDSITQGLGNTPYPSRLQDLLGDGYEVKNFGIYATTACFNTGRPYTSCEDSCYQASLDYQPDVVIIMLGTNDGNESGIKNAREHFKEDMTALVNSYVNLKSAPEVWIVTSPYAYLPSNAPVNTEIAPMQRELAKELSLPLLDMHALTSDMPENFQDGLHPTEGGYFYLALNVYEKIFGGAVADVTVKTTPNASVTMSAYTLKADANGEAVLRMPVGDLLLTVTSRDYEPVYQKVTVPGDCVISCPLSQSINLSLSGTPLSNGDAENLKLAVDGDLSTGWQNGEKTDGLYLGVDLKKNRTFSRVTVCFETATRPTPSEDGFTVEYSFDGSAWQAVTDPVYTFDGGAYPTAMDSVAFAPVAARYLRVVMHSFTSDKYAPKIYELAAYAAAESEVSVTVTQAVPLPVQEPDAETNEGSDTGGLKKYLPFAAAGAAAVIAVCVAVVIMQTKRKSSNKS